MGARDDRSDFFAKLGSGVYWRDLSNYPLAEHTNSMMRTFVGWFGWMRVALPTPSIGWVGGCASAALRLRFGCASAALRLLLLAILGAPRLPLTRYHRGLAGWPKRALVLFALAILVQLVLAVSTPIGGEYFDRR